MTKELAKDIIQWDIKSWSKALEYWDNNTDWNNVKNGLELGGREGGLSLWLALKGKETVCSDLKDVKKQRNNFTYNTRSLHLLHIRILMRQLFHTKIILTSLFLNL
jgi:hypothetical protein